MKTCSQCKDPKPLSDFGLYKNGKPLAHCRKCHNAMTRASRAKNVPKTKVFPEYARVRHPDNMVHEGDVLKAMKKVADEQAKIAAAHLGFEPEAGVADMILKG